MLTKEEIKNKLAEDADWTLPDDASDEEWDMYFDVKDEMGQDEDLEDEEWEDEEEF